MEFLPVPLGIALLVLLGAALAADLSVTVSAILKLNRQLEAMEKVAEELRELSDKVGSNIYENMTDAIEKQEEGRKRLEEAMRKLRIRYEELSLPKTRVSARLLKAFPKMESRNHKDMLEEIRRRMKNKR